jgi:hypothetical protein
MDGSKSTLRRFAATFITMQVIVKTCLILLIFLALLIAACAVTFPQILSARF